MSAAQSSTGILAEGAREARERIVEMLTKAYWMEVETVMSYLANSVNPDGVRAQEIIKSLREDIQEELTEAELQHDSESALAALESVGVRPRLWRAPWGVCTDASHRIAERLGLQLVRWSIDTHDWRGDPPRAMLDHARSQLADGGTVLMHDALGPGARRGGCQNTLALVPQLAAAARAHGLLLAPMGYRAHRRPLATGQPTTGAG